MITICPGCSGIDVEKLEEKFGKDKVSCSCIGACGGREGIIFGYANKKFIEAESEEEFIEAIENN